MPGFPGPTDRTTIIGRTGSGKTQAALWLLSRMNWTRRPWIIIDYKGLDFNELPGAYHWRLGQVPTSVPRRSGLYVVHPMPTAADNERVEALFWRIWRKGRVGVLIDEGYLTPRGEAFSALLVTGRAKQIPMIINSQRPVLVPTHVWSETGYFMVFHLNHRRDERTVEEFTPFDLTVDLPRYHSRWYDVANNEAAILLPVPDRDTILATFSRRLRERRSLWNGSTLPGPLKTGLQWS